MTTVNTAAKKLAALSNAKGMTPARKIACRRNLAKGRKMRWRKKSAARLFKATCRSENAKSGYKRVGKKGWLNVE